MSARALGIAAAFILTVVVARQFGSDRRTDIAFNALVLPMSFMVIVGSVVPPVVVSVFKSVQARCGDEEAWRFSRSALIVLTLCGGLLALAGALASPLLARILGMGFQDDVEPLARFMSAAFVIVMFSAIASVMRGILNANDSFLAAALDTFMLNATASAMVIFAGSTWGVFAIVAGTIAGSVVRIVVMLPSYLARRSRTPLGPIFHPEMRGLFQLLWPVLITSTLYSLNVLVTRSLASRIPGEGAVSHLTYGEKVALMPNDLIVMAIGTVLLPALAGFASSGNREEMRRLTSLGLRITWMLVVPAGVGLIVLSEPIVQLLFERGRFAHPDTLETAGVVRYLAISVFVAGSAVFAQAFYAMRATRSILIIGLAGLATNLLLSLTLVGPMRQQGLALAGASANVVAFLLYGGLLSGRIGGLGLSAMGPTLLRVGSATGVMTAAVWFGSRYALPRWPLLPAVATLVVGGAVLYLAILRLLGGEEWRYFTPRTSPPPS